MAQILILEDDNALRETLAMALTKKGHMVVSAASGDEGIEKLVGGDFDLVVIDILMPGIDGFGVLQEMKRLLPAVPTLAISGGGRLVDYDFLEGASTMGASETLKKPFSVSAFYDAVTRCLEK